VAGAKSLGILHAPAYPAYVLAARAFAIAEPFGSWAWRVNMFSLICAALTTAIVYLIARRLGAGVVGSVVGALTLALTASFWFYAGFAKHYPFSGLLVATAMVLVLAWERRGRSWQLVAGGASLGICTGASWQLAAITFVGLAVLVALGERRPRVAESAFAIGALAVIAIALMAYLMARARHDPLLNWGDARDLSRLRDVVSQRDFGLGGSGVAVAGRVPARMLTYLGLILRDVGLGAISIAVVGAIVARRRSGRAHAVFLAVIGVLNLLLAILAAGLDTLSGFDSGLIVGGFLIDVYVVLAVLVALGTTELVDVAVKWGRDNPGALGDLRLTRVRVRAGAVGVVVAVALVPSVIVHYQPANHHEPAFVDLYGQRVLGALPRNAVLVVGGYGYGLPELYRQIVFHDRTDVTVIDGGTTIRPWYRELLSRRYHVDITRDTEGYDALIALVAHFRATRPVYLDTTAMGLFRDAVGYRAEGLVGVVVDGVRGHPGTGLDRIAADLDRADAQDGVASRVHAGFPNAKFYLYHNRAHVELAKQYYAAKQMADVDRQLSLAIALDPGDIQTRSALSMLRGNDPRLATYISEI
jgi:Protein O-mannosyl-transferase TMEM260-like